jgi:hypothetical protein
MNNKRWNKFVPLVVVVLLIILFVAFYSPARGYFNKLFFGTNNLAQVSSTQCNDGIDNDGDGLTDWQNDLGCYGPQDNTEGGISASTDNGWTVFEKSPDTHIIYVSSSTGSDINDGLTPGTAVQTIAAGSALLRNGYPDWLLLKRGDTWHEGFSNWKKSGRSATAPLVIASYGPSSVRPLLDTTQPIYAQSATPGEIPSYVAIVGMNFYAGERDPNSPEYVAGTEGDSGIRWLGGGNLLIEDTVIRFYRTGITISPVNTPTLPNIKIRRSIIADSYINTAHSQGLFVDGVDGLLIEDNVFDHNGWNDNAAVGKETVFNHNIYSEPGNQNVTIRNNIIARASSHGLQARGGGTISDNLFFRDAVGMSFGLVNGGDNAKIGGVEGIISNNVYLESKNIGTSIRGYALEITNTKPGGTTAFRNNIIAHVTSGAASDAIQIGYGQPLDPNSAIGVNDLSIVGNTIYEWPPVYISPNLVPGGTGYTALKNLSFTNNDFQYLTSQYPNDPIIFHGPAFSSANESFAGNRYMSSLSKASWFSVASAPTSWDTWHTTVDTTGADIQASYPDSNRSVGSYNASLGGTASSDAFLAKAKTLSKYNWDDRYTAHAVNDYIRAGFGIGGSSTSTYTILATASVGGVISPNGSVSVVSGASQTFTITKASGYDISNVLVDGSPVGPVTSYTFTNVATNHTISVAFTPAVITNYTVTSSAGTGGTISPSGTITLAAGTSQTFSIIPQGGYKISSVTVDGTSVGAVSSYTFPNISRDHTISATFSQIVSYTISASTQQGGIISPSGNVVVPTGGSQTFTLGAQTGYTVQQVVVDGVNRGVLTAYTFSNVVANHSISVRVKKNPGKR